MPSSSQIYSSWVQDVEAVLALHAPDAEFVIPGQDMIRGNAALLEELLPGGKFRYDARTAHRWLETMEERERASQSPEN